MFKQSWKRLAAAVLVLISAAGMFPGVALAATAPSITWQPEDYTASAGWIVSLDVWATGTGPLFYQWYRDDVPLSDGGNIGGATTKNLIIGNVQESDEASYSCYVYNIAGNVTSNAATLTVNPSKPSIVLQPASQTVTAGDTASFKTAAVGSEPFAYQWRKDGGDLSDGGRISGANTDTLSISSLTEADAGDYSCYITNIAGNATSSSAALTVNLQHTQPSIIAQPADKTVPLGGSATFTVSAAGNTPFTYQWKKDDADLSNGGCINGANSSTLRIANLQNSNAGMYTCLVSNDYGSELSNQAELKISPALPNISIPQPPVKIISNTTFGSFYKDAINGQIWASDLTVDHCEYQLVTDGDSLSDTWIQDSLFTIAPDFKGRLYARAVYANGTASDNKTQALVVDATPPEINVSYNELSGSITATVTDNCAGIETITYQVGSGMQQTIDLEPSSTRDIATEHEFTISGLPLGQYNVTINATDNSHNVADTKTIGIDRADTPVTDIIVTGTGGADSVKVGDTLQMLAGVSPANTIHKAVTWSIETGSSNASIGAAGLLTATAAGPVTVRAAAQDGSGVYGEEMITVIPLGTAPDITTTALPGGSVGKPYSQTLAAAGDTPITWAVDSGSLPNGLKLSGSMISGTPAAAGTFNFTVKATNATGNDTQALSIVINAAAPDKTLVSVTAPAAITGVANGAAKTAAALGLPGTVILVTDGGNVSGNVMWDVASSPYNPSVTAAQTFTVNGALSLPAGVSNPNNVSLNMSITVSVSASSIYVDDQYIVDEGDKVTVDLTKGSSILSDEQMGRLIEENKDNPITLHGNGYTITFPAGSLQNGGDRDYDLGLGFNTGESYGAIKTLSGDGFVLMLDFNYSGTLPGEAQIRVYVGTQYAGQTLYYYYYNPQTGRLEFMQSAKADKDGYVTVRQSRCSSYLFALYDKDDMDDIPKTGDNSSNLVWWLLCGASAAGITALVVFGKLKKGI